ncbi:Bidirectional sugar transporter SWEET5 [Raphanus sativus]|uniref:Bidirectional sugar transporter SWEET n=1 Tax=Raphanus sativus TaxID=3726 RepID=A0A6J0LFC4_RAPSA|nr:bidirectional sugar transporter SWEET5-like [Raphanus sativus]KAJ4877558.1 Bidirectional sugar transporter SWEET5 [Raphanus sativus]
MTDTNTARTIVGIIGNVIAFGMYSAPIPTMVKIWKMKSVSEFKPDPYLATVLNCMMWAFYGLPFITPNNILLITNNGVGLVMALVYVIIFFIFATSPVRKKITIAMVIEVILMAVVVFCTLYFLHTTKKRSMLVGILCVIFNVIMYVSPLTAMRLVIKKKSVKCMPFFVSLADFMNGAIWLAYACLKFDLYILIPNVLGCLSGIIQLIIYALYYKTTNWEDDDEDKENSNSNAEIEPSQA